MNTIQTLNTRQVNKKTTMKELTMAKLDMLKKKFDIEKDQSRLGPCNQLSIEKNPSIYFNNSYFQPILKKY